jgi:predicted DCC family thiol-disulfide oxidoreductase YuxK
MTKTNPLAKPNAPGTYSADAPIEVFFDGACPLCVSEINLLRRLDRHGQLRFIDIAPLEAEPMCPLPRADMLARFHIRQPNGGIISGAAAFFAVWGRLPFLGWLQGLAKVKPVLWLAEAAYGAFLKVRPSLQRLARQNMRKREAGPSR